MILCIHRQKPNWTPSNGRVHHRFGKYWVETDGPAPTQDEVDAVLNPPRTPLTLREKLAGVGIDLDELKAELTTVPQA